MGRRSIFAMVVCGSLIVAGQVWLLSAMLSKPLPSGKTGWERLAGARKKKWEKRPDVAILEVGNVRSADGGNSLIGGARFAFDIQANQCTGSADPTVCNFCICWDEVHNPVPEVSAIVADSPMSWPVSITESNVIPRLEAYPNGRTLYVIAVSDKAEPIEYRPLLVKADTDTPNFSFTAEPTDSNPPTR